MQIERIANSCTSIFILTIIFIILFCFRISPSLNHEVEFDYDKAFHYRMTEEVVENGDVPAVDNLSTYPIGKNIKAFLPTGMYYACGLFHKIMNKITPIPLKTSILLFCSFVSSLIIIPIYFISLELYGNRIIAFLSAFLAGIIPAYLHRTFCYWYRYEVMGTPILFVSLLFFIKSFRKNNGGIVCIYFIASVISLLFALVVWRISILFLVVYILVFFYFLLRQYELSKTHYVMFVILFLFFIYKSCFNNNVSTSTNLLFLKSTFQIILNNVGIKQDFNEFTRLLYYNKELLSINISQLLGSKFLSYSWLFLFLFFTNFLYINKYSYKKDILFIFLVVFTLLTFTFLRLKIILGPLVALTFGESIILIYNSKRLKKLLLLILVFIALLKTGYSSFNLTRSRPLLINPYFKQATEHINKTTSEDSVILCLWSDGYLIQTYCKRATITDGLFESPEIVKRIISISKIYYSDAESDLWDFCREYGVTHILFPVGSEVLYARYAGIKNENYYFYKASLTPPARKFNIYKLLHHQMKTRQLNLLFSNRKYKLYSLKQIPDAHAQLPIDKFLEVYRPKYERAVKKAERWLDTLHVDPIELSEQGIKGKKKLVELLDAYLCLWRIVPDSDKELYMNKIKEIVAITYAPRYHDMARLSPKLFKQDATSYFRACYLMDKIGLPTDYYKKELLKIVPKINEHLKIRGPHQRMAFKWYYDYFGFKYPKEYESAFEIGVIANRKDPNNMDVMGVYSLTHEIFVVNDFGKSINYNFFSDDELRYITNALTILTKKFIERKDVDLVSELISSMYYTGLTHLPVYQQAVIFLLGQQNKDGSFGDYENQKEKWGELVRYHLTLHTTSVAIAALTSAFDQAQVRPTSKPKWHDTDWKYQRAITIDNNGNVSRLTDYQVNITLTPNNFDYSHTSLTGADIRFTDSDGKTTLDYWIEEWNNTGISTIWVEIPNIPASSNKIIYMYYGNPKASSTSSIDETFIFGDDFSCSSMPGRYNSFVHIQEVIPNGPPGAWDEKVREKVSLIVENGIYKLWYSGHKAVSGQASSAIGYAISIDGIKWVKYSGNPVLASSEQLQDPSVVKYAGVYYMYIERNDSNIDLYTSTDGINWTPYKNNPVKGPHAATPLVWIEGTTWYMLYEANMNTINLATSTDGMNWRLDRVVLYPDEPDEKYAAPDSIVKIGSIYHLYYHVDHGNRRAKHAISANLTTWANREFIYPQNFESFVTFNNNDEIWSYAWDLGGYLGGTNSGGGRNGAYHLFKGYPKDYLLDTKKWILEQKGGGGEIQWRPETIELSPYEQAPSSVSLKSIPTFTNDIIIEIRRKILGNNFAHVSLGSGNIVDIAGGTANWWHTTLQSGYCCFIQDTSTEQNFICLIPASGPKLQIGAGFIVGTNIHRNYEIHKFIYDSTGNLQWEIDNILKTNAVDATFLNDPKHILISQGGNCWNVKGDIGQHIIDWIRVRKYTPTKPSSSIGSEFVREK